MNKTDIVTLTPTQQARVDGWLHGLSCGLTHDGEKVTLRDLCKPIFIRDPNGLYAICGNASIKLDGLTE